MNVSVLNPAHKTTFLSLSSWVRFGIQMTKQKKHTHQNNNKKIKNKERLSKNKNTKVT